MALEDFADPEVAVVAAAAAVVFSPTVRGWLRRGAVYGMAGVLVAGDAITSVAHGVGQGARQAGMAASHTAQNAMNQAKNNAAPAESSTNGGQSQTAGNSTANHTESSAGGSGETYS